MTVYFISGHRSVSPSTIESYEEVLIKLCAKGKVEFVVGDYQGVDDYTQKFLGGLNKELVALGKEPVEVTVYHMLDSPVHNSCNFPTVGGFKTDHERDSAMTLASDHDIAFVEEDKLGSGTHQNVLRRSVLDAMKRMDPKKPKEFAESLLAMANAL